MNSLETRYRQVLDRIREAERLAGREAGSVGLLAVSKRHSVGAIREAFSLGQHRFGENYVSEAVEKMQLLDDLAIEWHYIGPIQSNKTRDIATRFQWVHSVDREKILRRLSLQRDPELPPLNCLIQVHIGDETSKSGCDPEAAQGLAQLAVELPGIAMRGLMTIPPASDDPEQQRAWFGRLGELATRLAAAGLPIDHLSMGMTQDLEAAVAEGATIVRVGTALFGPRPAAGRVAG